MEQPSRGWSTTAIIVATVLALLLFLSTLQLDINGSEHRYATDVGEIQNALPRWGTIHFTGYPQYTALGSIFVNGLRLVGLPPAAGASLFSAVWGAAAAGLLTALILSFHVPPIAAVLSSLLFTMSTSMWVDGSIAELHTMTMALTFAALLMAVRFRRSGRPADLFWLVFISSQGLTHQRAFAFLAPALALLVFRHWRIILQKWLPLLGLALLGPLTYLYLPLVDWLGSQWVFSAPGTWQGFWALLLDTKADRIVSIPASLTDWGLRLKAVVNLLNDDWPAPLWIVGLLGVALAWRPTNIVERTALTLTWLVYLILSLVIWEGFISDALLAVKLPVIAMAAIGLAFIAADLAHRSQLAGRLAIVGGLAIGVSLVVMHRPQIIQITRDDRASQTIATAASIPPVNDGRPVTLMALWGNDFWQLAYAQAYKGRFPHLNVVDHNANFQRILSRGHHLYTLSRTFLTRPLAEWEEQLGAVQLSSVAPGVVEIRRREKQVSPTGDDLLPLGNGISVHEARLTWRDPQTLQLSVQWQAHGTPERDYSVAVHLVSQDPPTAPEHVLAQADSAHPVHGWYPTSQWQNGEMVRDHYLLIIPPESEPVAVRVGMYHVMSDGQFQNTEVLSLPLPPRP